MKTMIKILAAAGVLGALGYAFRKQLTNALDAVLTKVDLLIPDPGEDEGTVYRGTAPAPDLTDSYPVGKRGPGADA
jgi:hypothetical protein